MTPLTFTQELEEAAKEHRDGFVGSCVTPIEKLLIYNKFIAGGRFTLTSKLVRDMAELLVQATDGKARLVVPGYSWHERVKLALAAFDEAVKEK